MDLFAKITPELLSVATSKEEHHSVFCKELDPLLTRLGELFPHLALLQGHQGVYLNMNSCVVRAAVVVAAQDDSFSLL